MKYIIIQIFGLRFCVEICARFFAEACARFVFFL